MENRPFKWWEKYPTDRIVVSEDEVVEERKPRRWELTVIRKGRV